jgi:hypothetical protein
MSSWDTVVDCFSSGIIPKSEYVYMAVILCLCVVALWKARQMVSEI